MDKNSQLDCYLYFLWNAWSKGICLEIFGNTIGEHIWGKWVRECNTCGAKGAPAAFYAELDKANRAKIVEKAVRHYNC